MKKCLIVLVAGMGLFGCHGGGGGGGGGKKNPPAPKEKFTGQEDKAYSETLYNTELNFTLSVPDGWSISSSSFMDNRGNIEGNISGIDKTGSFEDSINRDQSEQKNSFRSYKELDRFKRFVDSEEARIVRCDVEKKDSGSRYLLVTLYVDKQDKILKVSFEIPYYKWSKEISWKVMRIIDSVTRKNSLLGKFKRVINQFEYSYEAEDLDYYWSLISDSAYQDLLGLSREEALKEIKKVEKELYEKLFGGSKRWVLDFWNIRDVVQEGDYLAGTLELYLAQYEGGKIVHGGEAQTERITLVKERGFYRLCGEKVLGGGEWGKNLSQKPSNKPPVAQFSFETNELNVRFDAWGCYDPDHPSNMLEVRWDWNGDGNWDTKWSDNKTDSHTYSTPGTYQVTLQVRDPEGSTGSTTKTVKVSKKGGGNTPPSANFTYSVNYLKLSVDASSSHDKEDPIGLLQVRWDWNGDGNWDTSWSYQKTASHTYSSAGRYKVVLEVKDSGGLTNSTYHYVDTNEPKGWLWYQDIGWVYFDEATDVASFPDGSCVVAGHFAYTTKIGSSALFSKGKKDVYVAVIDKNGKVLYARNGGGASDDYANAVASFPDGSCILAGTFSGSAYFDSMKINAIGKSDIFVVKFKKGHFIGAQRAGCTTFSEPTDLASFSDGSFVMVGHVDHDAVFGSRKIYSSYGDHGFVAKYDNTGYVPWVNNIEGKYQGDLRVEGVASFSDGSCVVVGYLDNGTIDFGGSKLSSKDALMFGAKYSKSGKLLWVKSLAKTYNRIKPYRVASFSDGSFIVSGWISGSATFGSTKVYPKGGDNVFAARYNYQGTFQWVRLAGGNGGCHATSVASLPDGSCIVSGWFKDRINFGFKQLSSIGGEDGFFARYDRHGNVVSVCQIKDKDMVEPHAVAVLPDGSVVIVGFFYGKVFFGSGGIYSNGSSDAFVARYRY